MRQKINAKELVDSWAGISDEARSTLCIAANKLVDGAIGDPYQSLSVEEAQALIEVVEIIRLRRIFEFFKPAGDLMTSPDGYGPLDRHQT